MLLPDNYSTRAGTVGELVDEVCAKLSERLGSPHFFHPVFVARDGRVYAVEVWMKARPANQRELEEVGATFSPEEFAQLAAGSKLPACDDL